MTTQAELVRAHLEAGKSITPVIAMTVYGISRLSSCIEDIRNVGLEVDCVMKRDEMGKRYGEYRLRQAIKVGSTVHVKPGNGYGLPKWVRFTRGARVIDKKGDASNVHFVRGANVGAFWLNDKELINAA